MSFKIKECDSPVPYESKGKKIKFVNDNNELCRIMLFEGKTKQNIYLSFIRNDNATNLTLSNEAVKALQYLLANRDNNR